MHSLLSCKEIFYLLRMSRINLFRLYILLSRDNTQEDWCVVLLIKKNSCKHEYVCMHSFNEQKKASNLLTPEYYHMICIGKTKCTSEKRSIAK